MATEDHTLLDVDYQRPQPADQLPIGLVGCGGIADTHLSAYREAGYDVVALCDLEEERASELRDEYYSEADVYTDYQELLNRDDVAVVDAATHPGPRSGIIEDAIRAEKHVLSQKPFVRDLATGRRLVDLADKHDVKLAVNQSGRWAPFFAYIKKAHRDGEIGSLRSSHMSFHWNHDSGHEGEHHLFYRFAIHFIDQLVCLSPERAESVYATTGRAADQFSEIPLLGQINISFPTSHSSITLDGAVRAGVNFRTYIAGSEASFECVSPGEPWDAGPPETPPRLPWERTRLTAYLPSGALTPELSGSWETTGFSDSMGELQSAIAEDREPSHSGRDNLETMAVCFAACGSAADGEPKKPGEVAVLPSG